jgi:hypothetical protein
LDQIKAKRNQKTDERQAARVDAIKKAKEQKAAEQAKKQQTKVRLFLCCCLRILVV